MYYRCVYEERTAAVILFLHAQKKFTYLVSKLFTKIYETLHIWSMMYIEDHKRPSREDLSRALTSTLEGLTLASLYIWRSVKKDNRERNMKKCFWCYKFDHVIRCCVAKTSKLRSRKRKWISQYKSDAVEEQTGEASRSSDKEYSGYCIGLHLNRGTSYNRETHHVAHNWRGIMIDRAGAGHEKSLFKKWNSIDDV